MVQNFLRNGYSVTEQYKKIKVIQTLLVIIVLVSAGYYVYSHKKDFASLLEIDWLDFVALLVVIGLTSFFNASQNAVLIRSLGTPLSDLESFGLSNVSALVNFIVPQGITITKAVYLKQRYAVSYSKFTALFLGLLVIFLFVGSLLMAIANTTATILGILVPGILWIVCFLGCASSFLFFIDFPKKNFRSFGGLGKMLESFSEGWRLLRKDKSCLFKASLWQIAIFISSGIGITIAYHSINIDINPILGISLAVFISFSNLIVIIPGNFGIQESIFGYLSYLSGLLFVQGVVISTLMRTTSFIVTVVIAPFSWYFLIFRQKIKLTRKS